MEQNSMAGFTVGFGPRAEFGQSGCGQESPSRAVQLESRPGKDGCDRMTRYAMQIDSAMYPTQAASLPATFCSKWNKF